MVPNQTLLPLSEPDMPKRSLALLLLLAACSAPGPRVQPAATPGSAAGATKRPVELGGLALPQSPAVAFHSSRGATPDVDSAPLKVEQQGPLAMAEQSITLTASAPSRGELALVLPIGVIAAELSGAGLSPELVELSPEPSGRLFRSHTIDLAAGERRTLTLRFASADAGAGASLSGHGLTVQKQVAARGASDVPASVTFLIDTSFARGHQLARQLEILSAFAQALPPTTALRVAAYDVRVEPLFDGDAAGLDGSVVEAVQKRGAFGGSSVTAALSWVAKHEGGPPARVVLVSDGHDSFTGLDAAALKAIVPPSTRVDVLVPWGPSEPRGLSLLAQAGKPGQLVALSDEAASARLLGARDFVPNAPTNALASFPFAAELAAPGTAVLTVQRASETGALAPWLAQRLEASAKTRPAARQWERVDAVAMHVRPLPSSEEQRADFDPMEDLAQKTAAPEVSVSPKSPPSNAPQQTSPQETKGAPPAPAAAPAEPRPQIPPDTIRGIVRRNFGALRFCYREALRKDPKAAGKITIVFDIDESGRVPLARARASELSPQLTACFVRAFEALSFPASPSGVVTITYPMTLAKADASGETEPEPSVKQPRKAVTGPALAAPDKDPWEGTPKKVYEATARGDHKLALALARAFTREAPRDPLGLLLLADASAAGGDAELAERALTSLVLLDRFDARAQRWAAGRLAGLPSKSAHEAAKSALTRALELEPDGVSAYRSLALLLAAEGELVRALSLLDAGLSRAAQRHTWARDLFRKDLGTLAAIAAGQDARLVSPLGRWLGAVGASLDAAPSLRIALVWEDDQANLDLVVSDRSLASATPTTPNLPAGGRLLHDVTGHGGPEAFVLEQSTRNYPYALSVTARQKNAGFVAGAVWLTDSDGKGSLKLLSRPYLINVVGGRAELGSVDAPL